MLDTQYRMVRIWNMNYLQLQCIANTYYVLYVIYEYMYLQYISVVNILNLKL